MQRWTIISIAAISTALFCYYMIVWPPALRRPDLLPPALLASVSLFGLFCGIFLVLFFIEMERGGSLSITSRWSGLGGGMVGWRLSRSLTFLLIALLFGGVSVGISVQQLQFEWEMKKQHETRQFELQKLREMEERKYRDAQQIREVEMGKAWLGKQDSAKEPPAKPGAQPPKTTSVPNANPR